MDNSYKHLTGILRNLTVILHLTHYIYVIVCKIPLSDNYKIKRG
jgi:hypothetical protein